MPKLKKKNLITQYESEKRGGWDLIGFGDFGLRLCLF